MKAKENNLQTNDGSANEILIIDDDSRNIFALRAVLKSKGYNCVVALNAFDGLALLANQNDIGIVLLDMMMPDMDGYETLMEIRKGTRKNVPVIAVTAQAMVGDKERCLEAGANAYIPKPIDVDILVELLNRYLSKHVS